MEQTDKDTRHKAAMQKQKASVDASIAAADLERGVAILLTGQPAATADDAVAWLQALARDLAIPSLAAYGYRADDAATVVAAAKAASSMKANPLPLSEDELRAILAAAA